LVDHPGNHIGTVGNVVLEGGEVIPAALRQINDTFLHGGTLHKLVQFGFLHFLFISIPTFGRGLTPFEFMVYSKPCDDKLHHLIEFIFLDLIV